MATMFGTRNTGLRRRSALSDIASSATVNSRGGGGLMGPVTPRGYSMGATNRMRSGGLGGGSSSLAGQRNAELGLATNIAKDSSDLNWAKFGVEKDFLGANLGLRKDQQGFDQRKAEAEFDLNRTKTMSEVGLDWRKQNWTETSGMLDRYGAKEYGLAYDAAAKGENPYGLLGPAKWQTEMQNAQALGMAQTEADVERQRLATQGSETVAQQRAASEQAKMEAAAEQGQADAAKYDWGKTSKGSVTGLVMDEILNTTGMNLGARDPETGEYIEPDKLTLVQGVVDAGMNQGGRLPDITRAVMERLDIPVPEGYGVAGVGGQTMAGNTDGQGPARTGTDGGAPVEQVAAGAPVGPVASVAPVAQNAEAAGVPSSGAMPEVPPKAGLGPNPVVAPAPDDGLMPPKRIRLITGNRANPEKGLNASVSARWETPEEAKARVDVQQARLAVAAETAQQVRQDREAKEQQLAWIDPAKVSEASVVKPEGGQGSGAQGTPEISPVPNNAPGAEGPSAREAQEVPGAANRVPDASNLSAEERGQYANELEEYIKQNPQASDAGKATAELEKLRVIAEPEQARSDFEALSDRHVRSNTRRHIDALEVKRKKGTLTEEDAQRETVYKRQLQNWEAQSGNPSKRAEILGKMKVLDDPVQAKTDFEALSDRHVRSNTRRHIDALEVKRKKGTLTEEDAQRETVYKRQLQNWETLNGGTGWWL